MVLPINWFVDTSDVSHDLMCFTQSALVHLCASRIIPSMADASIPGGDVMQN